MDEEDGIEFHSSEKITIATEKKLDMDCKKLKIESGDKIILTSCKRTVVLWQVSAFLFGIYKK